MDVSPTVQQLDEINNIDHPRDKEKNSRDRQQESRREIEAERPANHCSYGGVSWQLLKGAAPELARPVLKADPRPSAGKARRSQEDNKGGFLTLARKRFCNGRA